MENESLLNKNVKVFGITKEPITTNVWWENKTTITVSLQKESITPKGITYSKLLEFKFNKETKQLYPKKDHKNCLVVFGIIPYFELIEDEK